MIVGEYAQVYFRMLDRKITQPGQQPSGRECRHNAQRHDLPKLAALNQIQRRGDPVKSIAQCWHDGSAFIGKRYAARQTAK